MLICCRAIYGKMTITWLNRIGLSSRGICTTLSIFKIRGLHISATFSSPDKIIKSSFQAVDLPESGSFTDHVFKNAHLYKDRVALVEAETGRSLTYQDLQSSIRKLGSGLTNIHGFQKGEVVCMYSPSCIEYVVALHGVTSIGGIVTTCNPSFTTSELLRQLKESNPRFLITFPEHSEAALSAASQAGVEAVYVIGQADGCESFDSLLDNNGENFPDVHINPREDIAILPYSSGTTGLPKGVMVTHYNITANIYQMAIPGLGHYRPEDVCVGFLPMYHAYGIVTYAALYPHRGLKTILMQSFRLEGFLDIIQKHKVTLAPVVPPVALMMAKSPMVDQYDLSSIQEIMCGAAPLGGSLVQDLKKRCPTLKRLRQGYGMTELGVSHLLSDDVPDDKYNSIGRLIPNQECKVVDISSGEVLGANEHGEICVRGPQVMKGYLNNPEVTAETITSDGWLHTGDIGYYDEDEYFYFLERLKELIKYKGLQIAPAELEELLISHPSVADAAVIGVDDEEAGEVPKAFVIRNNDVTAEDLKTFVEKNAAPFKKLRGGVEFVTEIPKTPSGKILRRVLIEQNRQRK